MGDAGEVLIDAESRIQERMEELERERSRKRVRTVGDPERNHLIESLRLARTELTHQLETTAQERRKVQIVQAIEEIDRRMAEAGALVAS